MPVLLRDHERLQQAVCRLPLDPNALRLLTINSWYDAALINGSDGATRSCEVLAATLASDNGPAVLAAGEITLAGYANLASCCGSADHTSPIVNRLVKIRTYPRGSNVQRQWHFSRAVAGVALGVRAIYRGPAAADCELDELMPFTPRILYGNNPQALLAHLAAGAENRVAIEDVWPAFRECVHNFPYHEEVGDFDGACLFWIARIVHHQIGGQPLGQTADWLSRHFNAWADGRDLPPLGAT